MERKCRIVSINGNNILITISGNVVDEKRYPSNTTKTHESKAGFNEKS